MHMAASGHDENETKDQYPKKGEKDDDDTEVNK